MKTGRVLFPLVGKLILAATWGAGNRRFASTGSSVYSMVAGPLIRPPKTLSAKIEQEFFNLEICWLGCSKVFFLKNQKHIKKFKTPGPRGNQII